MLTDRREISLYISAVRQVSEWKYRQKNFLLGIVLGDPNFLIQSIPWIKVMLYSRRILVGLLFCECEYRISEISTAVRNIFVVMLSALLSSSAVYIIMITFL